LNFSETPLKSDMGLNTLGIALDKLQSLHTLELYLSGDIGITIQSIRLVV